MRKALSIVSMTVVILLGMFVWSLTTSPSNAAPPAEPTTEPTTKPAVISAEAQKLIDQVGEAYSALKSLDLTGTVQTNLDAGGRTGTHDDQFTAAFQAPDKLRHEMKDDLLIVSNGEKGFIYKIDAKRYQEIDPIKKGATLDDLPGPVAMELDSQDPSLLFAIVKDPAAAITTGAATIDRDKDTSLDGTDYPTLLIKTDGQTMQMLIDPKTHLVRQVKIDVRDRLVQRGVPDVKTAMLTFNYTKSEPNAALEATAFNWTPPADALLVKPGEGSIEGDDSAAMALIGKPAPDFKLQNLKGEDVSLSAQKGHVVVLDFWATWCGPCVASMPNLQRLYNDQSANGLKLFGVNMQEPKDQVGKFLEDQKLTFPVLLDSGSTATAYKVEGIPQTVIIGKDGVVRKVFIGLGPDTETQLRTAVADLMKQ